METEENQSSETPSQENEVLNKSPLLENGTNILSVSKSCKNVDEETNAKMLNTGRRKRQSRKKASENENLSFTEPKNKRTKLVKEKRSTAKKSTAKKNKRMKKLLSDSDSQVSDFDISYKRKKNLTPPQRRVITRRAATKVKYTFDTEDDEESDGSKLSTKLINSGDDKKTDAKFKNPSELKQNRGKMKAFIKPLGNLTIITSSKITPCKSKNKTSSDDDFCIPNSDDIAASLDDKDKLNISNDSDTKSSSDDALYIDLDPPRQSSSSSSEGEEEGEKTSPGKSLENIKDEIETKDLIQDNSTISDKTNVNNSRSLFDSDNSKLENINTNEKSFSAYRIPSHSISNHHHDSSISCSLSEISSSSV